jgi:alpha-tubulin suppressor-like RCC1 family protein
VKIANFIGAILIGFFFSPTLHAQLRQVIAGRAHTCVLFQDGRVKCWGLGRDGQTGSADPLEHGDDPNEMGDNLPFLNLGTNIKVQSLGAGNDYTCVLTTEGRVKCFGESNGGVLGQGSSGSLGDDEGEMGDNLPFVDLGEDKKIKSFFIGVYHNCALFENDQIKCWGYNDHGQLGLGDLNNRGDQENEMGDNLKFVNLGREQSVLKIAGGFEHTCALLEGGRIKCWGKSNAGAIRGSAKPGQGKLQTLVINPPNWATIFLTLI